MVNNALVVMINNVNVSVPGGYHEGQNGGHNGGHNGSHNGRHNECGKKKESGESTKIFSTSNIHKHSTGQKHYPFDSNCCDKTTNHSTTWPK